MERAYSISTRATSAALALIGLALVVSTLARGGGPLAVGVVFGVLIGALGAGRLFLATRRR